MTAAELATVVKDVTHDARTYAPDMDADHDGYGCDTRDHHVFDHDHPEDAFPY